MATPLAELRTIRHVFHGSARGETHVALQDISATIEPGVITGVIGPDGAGKTTLLRLLAGLLKPTAGHVTVLGHDMATDAQAAHDSIGYMPQRFGLYEDLTVGENLALFADLHSMPARLRAERIERLLHFTALAPFTGRASGHLSGGMKQKLGLACALLARPRLLLLDEPSVGVDPASRRELWDIVSQMLAEGAAEGMGVVWATAYLDEAERCSKVLLLHEGKLLIADAPRAFLAPLEGRVFSGTVPASQRRASVAAAMGNPKVVDASLEGDRLRLVMQDAAKPEAGSIGEVKDFAAVRPRFEDGFIDRLAADGRAAVPKEAERSRSFSGPAIEAGDLVRRFGDFTAVDRVNFEVARGEIFGLLGPNGAGKSTIFRMLCGLLQPSAGKAAVAGVDLMSAPAEARQRIGYMAQRFSLYSELSVLDNLTFFARVYGLSGRRRREAVSEALARFELQPMARDVAGDLPLGVKQRLALAAALLHQPEILFLDEPTSGVDPLTRRAFWLRIGALADAGVTVLVTSHFMDEAEYCDRLAIISAGRLVATGTPADLRARVRSQTLPEPTLEDAFIKLVDQAREARAA